MEVHAEFFVRLMAQLDASSQGQRGKLIAQAATFLACTPATIYRRLSGFGWTSDRKIRSDCGKLCVDEALAITAAGMIKAATRANGKQTLGLTQVAKILEDNGMGVADLETGEITMPSASTIARAMRTYGCHPKQVAKGSPSQHMRSLYPNHVWQMDSSVCVLFYLPRGKVAVMDEKKFYKNKPQHLEKAEKARVIRWVITDHFSGSIFCRYTLGNEDAPTAILVLIAAMCRREADADMLHGAPEIFYTDNGSPFVAKISQLFFQSLRIQHITHAPGNARATGQVENAHNIIETQFESRLRFLDIDSIETLNSHLDAWRIVFNSQSIHSRYKDTRHNLWLTINKEQLRVPESAQALMAIVNAPRITRKVPQNMLLSFAPKGYDRANYNIANIDGIRVDQSVTISVNPYLAPSIDVVVSLPDGSETTYIIAPIATDSAGFDLNSPVFGEDYKAHKDTATDKAIKQMEQEAYSVKTMLDVDKAKKAKQKMYAHINPMADVQAAVLPSYAPVCGQMFRPAASPQREVAPMGLVTAARLLQTDLAQAGIEWTEEHMQTLATRYPTGLSHDAAKALAAEFIRIANPVKLATFQPLLLAQEGVA